MNAAARVGRGLKEAGIDYVQGLKNLVRCPREIWFAYLIKVLESLAYFSSVLVLMIFLTQDMGLSDELAGTVFGVWSASMSFFMLFVGFIADSLGIKKALIVGLLIALVGRVAITFTTNPWVVYPGLFVLSVGFAYMIPLIAAAVKLFSTKKAQKYAFSWYYVVMNIGAFIAGISLDGLRATFTEPIAFAFAGMNLEIRPIQIIFFVAVLATFVSLAVVFFLVRSRIPAEELADRDDVEAQSRAKEADIAQQSAQTKTPWQVMKEVIRERTFWIFIVFIFLLVLVKMIFQYNHSLYPLYMERIGFSNWTGKLYSINPLIIIFLVPVMTALTRGMNAYQVIMLGSFVAAGSVFFMGFGESIMLIVMFQIVLSIGEALYSPRIYDYTANVAPPGKESSYMAYSKAPMFFAKVAAGPLAGILLANLCAEGSTAATRNSELMWILVGASTMVSPVMLLLGRRWLDVESRKKRGELKELEAESAGGPEPAEA
ncbi:MAG: Dipeptide and tripeptide permease A [Calditrichaeota bacterium]|nr:Dipeptide and tripeptide permease A [Calditrichota bacterium]